MNLTPIYELRSRLRAAMIAGTNLISEDFRLKRAVEEIKPLEALSPIFAKIGQLTTRLLAEDCEDREGALIDTITLVDAVLCTQGQVTVSGELEPISATSFGSVITNAPYSVVKRLVEALTVSGSGHYQFVLDTHEQQPELFLDYRIKAAMVAGLGAGYTELAEKVEQWLKEESEEIVPLLMKGFDPKGKKEMVRRIRVMEAVAGGKCNEFYLQMLEDAQRDVKNELIYALRHDAENIDKLLELAKKEKGKAKECAYYALAAMEDERSEKLFRELYEKKPIDAMIYLRMSTTKWAAKMVGECLLEHLAPCREADYGQGDKVSANNELELLRMMIEALPGKTGPQICEAFRALYEVGDLIGGPFKGQKQNSVWEMHIPVRRQGIKIERKRLREVVPYLLESSIRLNADVGLCTLAEELTARKSATKQNELYYSALFTAKLLSTEDFGDWLKNQTSRYLVNTIKGLVFDEARACYVLQTLMKDEANETYTVYERNVSQDVDGKLMDYLISLKAVDIDRELMRFFNPQNQALCKKLEEYLYQRALTVGSEDCVYYWIGLRKCGCKRCDGLFVEFMKKETQKGGIECWRLSSLMDRLPGNRESFEKEAQTVYDMICDGKLNVRGWIPEYYLNNSNANCSRREQLN